MVRPPPPLLARLAEAAFWLARYVERTENLARLIDINETFARDSRGACNWSSIVALNADDMRFYARHAAASEATVLRFYLLDGDNPTSILSSIRAARENARSLRPHISTELWSQLNTFYNWVLALTESDIALPKISRLCGRIRESCQTHAGIADGTLYRDQAWTFYQLGRWLERADQTTRLLDIKYHTLLPSVDDIGSPLDASQWNAVLRSASAYHAFRRAFPRDLEPGQVAEFLLFDSRFPRSVSACVHNVATELGELRRRFHLRHTSQVMESVDELTSLLAERQIDQVLQHGLHEFLDVLQGRFAGLTGLLSERFFDYAPTRGGVAMRETAG